MLVACGATAACRIDYDPLPGGVDAPPTNTLVPLEDPASVMTDAGVFADGCSPASRPSHRYRFDGVGAVAVDSVGGAHGAIVGGAALDGSGVLSLDGADDYVDLPNRLLSHEYSLTIMIWLTWHSGSANQRIWDFGVSSAGEGDSGEGVAYFAATVSYASQGLALLLKEAAGPEHAVALDVEPPSDRPLFVAATVDGRRGACFYVDGARRGCHPPGFALRELEDVNNWLGRSQFKQGNNIRAELDEFRVYGFAFGDRAMAAAAAIGPDHLGPSCE